MAKATTKKVRGGGSVKSKGGDAKAKIGRARAIKPSPGSEIDARIIELADWRGEALAKVRILIKQVDRNAAEEVKWRTPSNGMAGVPVWSSGGIICTGETYRNVVKLTFPRGAEVEDPARLFNASLEGGTRRAIDIHEEDELDERAFKALVRAAIALNEGRTLAKKTGKAAGKPSIVASKPTSKPPSKSARGRGKNTSASRER